MSYSADGGIAPPTTAVGGTVFPWELDDEHSPLRQETWLLSFIDILALLLTLFVLLLAYQDRGLEPPGSAEVGKPDAAFSINLSLPTLNPLPSVFSEWRVIPADVAPRFAFPGPAPSPVRVATPEAHAAQTAVPSGAPPRLPEGASVGRESPDAVHEAPLHDANVVRTHVDEQIQAVAAPVGAALDGARATAEQLRASLQQTGLSERVAMRVRPGAVSLDISDSILFGPASAALSEPGLALLQELATVLRTLPYRLSVEGHTDNVPIKTALYPSNWELSSARAARVTRKLIEQGVVPDRIRAIGYGDTRPRAGNDSAVGRAENRRVTFVLRIDADSAAPAASP